MKKIFTLILCSFLVSCKEKNNEIISYEGQLNNFIIEKDTATDITYKIFYKSKKENLYLLDSILILKKTERQKLNLISKKIFTDIITKNDIYTNFDFNFDGINDIMIYPYGSPDFNYRGYHFIFNVKTKKYEGNNLLDSLYNIELNTNTKEICSYFQRQKIGYNEFSKYKWVNDSLKNTLKYIEKDANNGFVLSVWKNNISIVKDSLIKKSFIENNSKINCK